VQVEETREEADQRRQAAAQTAENRRRQAKARRDSVKSSAAKTANRRRHAAKADAAKAEDELEKNAAQARVEHLETKQQALEEKDAALTAASEGRRLRDAASRVKAEPLWVGGVLDASLDADLLLEAAADKIRRQGPKGCALLGGLRFVRAYVEPERVTVEAEDAAGARRLFAARLFVDASGAESKAARQLAGAVAARVCPTVGTLARGFSKGEGRDAVDFGTTELFVSTEDASAHRQLVWGGFPVSPRRDEYAAYLFFYDSPDSPADKSLLSLFERYFETLPAYKRRGSGWRVKRPLFGYAPAAVAGGEGWRPRGAGAYADDRVMLLGEAAGDSGPLAARGPRAHARDLRRLTHLTDLALEADMLDAPSLVQIADTGRRLQRAAGLSEFMRPAPKGAPSAVNETMNALMAALGGMDESVRRELFQGRASFAVLRGLASRTARLYPRIFARLREQLGARGTFLWLCGVAEAVWSERRGQARAGRGAERNGEDARERFARHARLYRDGGE
jgi:lycopene cyclase CruA